LLDVPGDAENAIPYQKRGWCVYETGVSSVGAEEVVSVKVGDEDLSTNTPVPFTPEIFCDEIQHLHFTNGRTDAEVVMDLFVRVFPRLAEHESIVANGWEDEDVHKLMERLPFLTKLRNVTVWNSQVSKQAKELLDNALRERGGKLESSKHADQHADVMAAFVADSEDSEEDRSEGEA